MKKINLILITLFAVVGAVLIYKFTDVPKSEKNSTKKIYSEYTMLSKTNVFENKSLDEINNVISNGTGIIFLCIPENNWCQYYIKYLNDSAIENGITRIYYFNIKQDRQYNTNGYRRLLARLDHYLSYDDEGNKRVFVPTLLFIKNGNIIAYDDETSIMNNKYSPETYYTEDKVIEFKDKLNNYFLQYKEEL